MKRVLFLLLSATVILGAFAAGKAETEKVPQKVVIYAALDEKTTHELAAAFKESTGIDAEVALQIEQAGTVAARIKTEAANPRADVFIGGNSNFHTELAAGGFLEKYRSPVVKEVGIDPQFMDPDGYWTGWYLGALCLLYNDKLYNEKVKPLGIAPPATWDDLLNPVYKGQVIASNPATTGGAYLMVAAQIFRLGSEEAGFEYIRKLHSNVAQYTKGANGCIPLIAQGEAMVGFAWGHDTLKQKAQGNLPIVVVFPKDTGFEIGAASILKGAPHLESAKKFIDFLLSTKAGTINARNGYRYPVRSGVELPPGVPPFESLKLAPWDLKKAAENVDKWKKQWSAITGM
jgi:iron(III) transport system substrate-binding protein